MACGGGAVLHSPTQESPRRMLGCCSQPGYFRLVCCALQLLACLLLRSPLACQSERRPLSLHSDKHAVDADRSHGPGAWWRALPGFQALPCVSNSIKQYQTGPSLRLAYLRLAGLAVLPFAWFSGFLPGHRLCPPPRYALLPSSALCPPLAGVVRSPPAVLVHSGGWTSGFQVHACGSA